MQKFTKATSTGSSMPVRKKKVPSFRLRNLRLTKKEEAKQHLKDLANPTVSGLKRTILREQTKKAKKKADDEWSRLRREKPSNGLGVGY